MNNMADLLYHHFVMGGIVDDKKLTNVINNALFKIDDKYKYPVEAMKEYILESVLIREFNESE